MIVYGEAIKPHARLNRKKPQGFSLIEVMIAVAIISILSAIAIPQYNGYVQRSHRSNARNALLQIAQWMERVATATGQYPECNTTFSTCTMANTANTGATSTTLVFPSNLRKVEGNHYDDVSMTVASTATEYTLQAVPNSFQAADKCGTFTLNHRGVKGLLPSPASAELVAECWGR